MSDADDYPGENIDREILEAERALEAENETLRAQRDALKEALEELLKWVDFLSKKVNLSGLKTTEAVAFGRAGKQAQDTLDSVKEKP